MNLNWIILKPIYWITLTSTHIYLDNKIEKRLPELNDPMPKYTRYADDMAISFKHYTTKGVLIEKFESYFQSIQQGEKPDGISIKEHMDRIMCQFMDEKFIITDRSEHKYLIEQIEKLKGLINDLPLSDEVKYDYIGQIHTYKQRIEFSKWRIENIKNEIIKIISHE